MASPDLPIIMRIYPTFTEIRQKVEVKSPHQMYIPQNIFSNIISGSLNLEGASVSLMNSVQRDNNLEGKEIHINKDKEIRKVKMIRSRDLLVQDLTSNRFYHVDRNQIEYSDIPEEMGTEVTFNLDNPGPSVLSYLMYGFTWRPRYSISLNGDNHSFESWADISNNTEQKYNVSQTELFGGDVNVVQNRPVRYKAYSASNAYAMDCRSAVPEIQGQSEVAGLYMYPIANSYYLEPRSTLSLPFISPTLKISKVAVMHKYFCENNVKAQSSRVYRVKSDAFLPAGSVTIREDGRVIGQAELQNLSADEEFDLTVGNDPDISYDRTIKTLEHNENVSQYEISISVKNKKSRTIDYEFFEHFNGRFEIKTDVDSVKVENDSIKKSGQLESNQSEHFKYVVKFIYN